MAAGRSAAGADRGAHHGGRRAGDERHIARGERRRTLGHAGQVLVGQAAASLAIDELPAGASLVDLGEHRLPGFERPERIFELRHADIRSEFPALAYAPSNLPRALTSFVGREAELDEVARLLPGARLLTLTGPGGSGKTRLALQAAGAAAAHYPDGVFLVELGRLDDPALVPGAVLGALGASEEPGQSPLDTAVRRLGGRRALVVLDNCEHLQDASADTAQELLAGCSHLGLLATSRESPLGVAGEVVFSVPGMGLPMHDAQDGLEDFDAVRLFVGRACQVRPDFTLDSETAPAVARICRSLDGMPLAIELAAARLRMLTVAQIADGLGDRLRLLTGGVRGALPRQRTLRASIEWSHELLDERERTLLRRLSVFSDGFTLELAEAVCSDAALDRSEVLELVGALIDKSLVATQQRGPAIRYRLLETVRQYAAGRLAEAGERDAVQRRHVRCFAALARDADRLRLEPDGRRRLDVEGPNLRAALEHAAETDPEAALAIAAGLSRWWIERDHYREGRERCARALAAGEPDAWPALRAIVHWGAGMLALYQADFVVAAESLVAALAHAEAADDPIALGRAHAIAAATFGCVAPVEGVRHGTRAVELLRPLGDEIELAWALAPLATAHAAIDDYPAASAAARECTAIAALAGDATIGAWAEWILGVVLTFEGRLQASVEHTRRAIGLIGASTPVVQCLALGSRLVTDAALGNAAAVLEEGTAALERAVATTALGEAAIRPGLCQVETGLGHLEQAALVGEPGTRSGILYFEGNAHDALAKVALARRDEAAARTHAAELDRLADVTGNPRFRAQAAYALGRAELIGGDSHRAGQHLHRALREQLALGARLHAIETLEALAAVAATSESWRATVRLLAAAGAERARLGAVRVPHETAWQQGVRHDAREALGDRCFDVDWDEGAAQPFADAVAYAQRSRGSRERPAKGWEALTPAERQVAQLAAEGMANPQIAQQLFISRSTVKVHLSRAFAKLDVANRTQLARQAPSRSYS